MITRVSQLSDKVVQDFFTSIISHAPKTFVYFGDEVNNFWYNFKYIRNYEKLLAPFIKRIFEENEQANLDFLGQVIGEEYDEMWSRLAKIYFAEYDPLTDYRKDDIFAGTENESTLEERNTKIETSVESETHTAYHGFNSTSVKGVPVTDSNGESTETKSGTENYNNTKNSVDRENTHSNQSIGYNTSPTELFSKEFRARRANLVDIIMQDIANYTTIAVY